jgi:hypothetical protein
MKKLSLILAMHPCDDAITFINSCNSLKQAWETCPRGDWMLWIASKLRINIRTLTLAKGLCAQTIVHLMKDPRSIAAVDMAILFGQNKCSLAQLNIAAYAAYAANAANTTANAANAAAYAANANAAYAAYAAAYAAYAAAAANLYTATIVKKENQLLTANICRQTLTKSVYWKLSRLK